MSKINFDATKVEIIFSALDDLALKELDNLIIEFNSGYIRWRDITIDKLLDNFEFEADNDKNAVRIVLQQELIPKLVYDHIYNIIEKFRKGVR